MSSPPTPIIVIARMPLSSGRRIQQYQKIQQMHRNKNTKLEIQKYKDRKLLSSPGCSVSSRRGMQQCLRVLATTKHHQPKMQKCVKLENYKKNLNTKCKIQKHKALNAKVKWEEDTAMSHSSYDGLTPPAQNPAEGKVQNQIMSHKKGSK